MWEDSWADLLAHLMTISCQDERKSKEEEERQFRLSALAPLFFFSHFLIKEFFSKFQLLFGVVVLDSGFVSPVYV